MVETVEHIEGGAVEIRMTDREKRRCARKCAAFGDPPCYELPATTSTWPKGEPVTPCNECAAPSRPA